jgi:hypothetical protein
LDHALAQHNRPLTTTVGHSLTTSRKAQPEHTGKAGQTSRYWLLTARNSRQASNNPIYDSPSVDRGLA